MRRHGLESSLRPPSHTPLFGLFVPVCVFVGFFLSAVCVCVSCAVLTVAAGVCFMMSRAFLGVFHSCINLARPRGAVCQTVSSAGAERADG